jgi:hypothetical protein
MILEKPGETSIGSHREFEISSRALRLIAAHLPFGHVLSSSQGSVIITQK